MNKLELCVLDRVTRFIHSLSEDEQSLIRARIESVIEGDFESVYIKTLKGPVKELIVRTKRIIFCIENNTMYVLGIFTKKSAKTPRNKIDVAEKIYRLLINRQK